MKNTVMTCDKSVVKRNLWFGVFLFVIQNLLAQAAPYKYVIAETPWPETFGSHRAVVEVARPAEVVLLPFEWRRHDENINNTRFLLISAASGDTIRNIRRMEVNNERCSLLFGPVLEKGTYYFYYLPHRVEGGDKDSAMGLIWSLNSLWMLRGKRLRSGKSIHWKLK